MNNGLWQKHWVTVFRHFALDAVLFALAFVFGMALRFGADWQGKLVEYYPSILLGAVAFPCTVYIFGLYAPQTATHGVFKRALTLLVCFGIALVLLLGMFYVNFSSRIGRGVMVLGASCAYLTALLHHMVLMNRLKSYRERLVMIVTGPFDEAEIQTNSHLWRRQFELVGVAPVEGFQPAGDTRNLGSVSDLMEIVARHDIDRVLCTNASYGDARLSSLFCQLRYAGVTVMPLISLCEEAHQSVPLELITTEWLLNASSLPHMLYIKKLKRGFDIASSLAGLVCLSPPLLFGIIATKLTSPGPVFYHQVRGGRFGRSFRMIKLRTMVVDAEKGGAVWAQAKDPRTTPVGGFLRKYRIDEIPQLVNVLRGEMSLVGPRPERPEFVDELAAQIPFYRERLMIQPGITGWAQVCYPYGASVEDARRKLEYDLYYMKHMSIFLDAFILLDTVRIILKGGLGEAHKQQIPRYETVRSVGARPDGAAVAPAVEASNPAR
ncbi:MAG: exopolysaccharide biosynthesis polyprenyl glycosylphosphotransferase [Verrucomicrobia bacterium]|nr:exopolysaccharide biosynthesis polyprenyl glycosylphosphotransferase [Verrucomicrobiota bacterium]